eukprot:3136289-Prymnesium_polylepis.1
MKPPNSAEKQQLLAVSPDTWTRIGTTDGVRTVTISASHISRLHPSLRLPAARPRWTCCVPVASVNGELTSAFNTRQKLRPCAAAGRAAARRA